MNIKQINRTRRNRSRIARTQRMTTLRAMQGKVKTGYKLKGNQQ